MEKRKEKRETNSICSDTIFLLLLIRACIHSFRQSDMLHWPANSLGLGERRDTPVAVLLDSQVVLVHLDAEPSVLTPVGSARTRASIHVYI